MQHCSRIYVLAVVTDIIAMILAEDTPEWTIPSIYQFAINSSNNAACDEITVVAGTSAAGGILTISIASQQPNGGFAIGSNIFDEFLKCDIAAIRNGTATSYIVVLRLSEVAGSSANITLNITVTGLPSNSNPEFNGTPYAFTVNRAELNTSKYNEGSTVYTVTTTDADSDTVTVNIETSTVPFIMNGSLIQVSDKDTLTAVVSPYEFVLVATDDGSPPGSSTTTFTMTINESPVFTEPNPNATLEEHKIYMCETLKGEDLVITLAATDVDSIDTPLIFSMNKSTNEIKELFEIIGAELKVKSGIVEGTFDYEKIDAVLQYPIVLEVSDELISTELSTNIYLEDDNDNAPEFADEVYTADISELTAPGTSVIQLKATDADVTSENNQVLYYLSDSHFILDQSTGDVTVAEGAVFNSRTKNQYNLMVSASDGISEAAMNTSAELNINILADCTKDLPSFDFGNATADDENTTTVGANATVNCNDGYETTTAKISCPSNGVWLTPTCTLKDCSVVPIIKHGAAEADAITTVNATAMVTCDDGYETTTAQITCPDTGAWPTPTCTLKATIQLEDDESRVSLAMYISGDSPNLSNPSVYNEVKGKIVTMIIQAVPTIKTFIVSSITAGSIQFTAFVIVDNEDIVDLAKELQSIRDDQTLIYDGQSANVTSLIVGDKSLPPSSTSTEEQVCEVYTSIVDCAANHACVYENHSPSCTLTEKENITVLVLALCLGVLLPLMLLLIIFACNYHCKLRQKTHTVSRSHGRTGHRLDMITIEKARNDEYHRRNTRYSMSDYK